MGTIYIDGQFKSSAKPGIDPDTLKNYTTKELVDKKVDKESGKGLSEANYTESEKLKLLGIETGANKYVHPTKHPASIITQDASNRFVTDAEKDSWNNKLGKSEEEAISFALNELNNKIEDILKYIKQLNIMIEKNI